MRATFIIERQGKIDLPKIRLDDNYKTMSLPDQGRRASAAILKRHKGKTVEVVLDCHGNPDKVSCGDVILLHSKSEATTERTAASLPAQSRTAPPQAASMQLPTIPEALAASTHSISQQRAAQALAQIKEMATYDNGHLKGHISAFPAMILMNGFGQACAFYRSKDEMHMLAYRALEQWLTSNHRPYAGGSSLMEAITQNDQQTYRRAQIEALAYLDWLKKFAAAYLKDQDKKQKDVTS